MMHAAQCAQATSDEGTQADPPTQSSADANEAVRGVEPLRISTSGGPTIRDQCEVAVEKLLTIKVEGVDAFTLMCTPSQVKPLAVGFAFSEGMISSIDDVLEFAHETDSGVVHLRLREAVDCTVGRSLIVTSSCGLCGSRGIVKYLAGTVQSPNSLRVPGSLLQTVARAMHARQDLFARTGGTHAAGVFGGDGDLVSFGQDIGRHNALDKSVGQCLIQRLSPAGHGVVLSGRVSLELVTKAARAGIELIAAVSAPSSLAIQVAQSCNITLCGFVRADRATVYTHPHRIEGLEG